jgi:protein-disulfide isomerase
VRFVFKHLPLSIHSKAMDAHLASEAAYQQGKFWEMHDMIFEDQRAMAPEKYVEYAGTIGIDVDQYKADLASAKVKARVDGDSSAAAKLGVTGTPAFFINGRYLSGAQPFSAFQRVIDEELKKQG